MDKLKRISGDVSSDASRNTMSGVLNRDKFAPVETKERYVILDILRGVALFGICLANFPEFSLYTFLGSEITDAMSTVKVDQIVRFLQCVFIDGKFYTLFSLLFGIGFSIIIANAAQNGKSGLRVFYRRMVLLFIIGLLHLMFIWSGDILVLYALLGLLLPLFRNISNQKLFILALLFLESCHERVLRNGTERISVIEVRTPVIHLQTNSLFLSNFAV